MGLNFSQLVDSVNLQACKAESCILWNDKSLNIDWEVNDPILSKKDMNGISFNDYISPF